MADPQFDESDVRAQVSQFLQSYGLPSTLMDFVTNAMVNGWGNDQIITELRQTPEYKAAFPEQDVRKGNGFDYMPESQILAYRDSAKNLAANYLGVKVQNSDIAGLIGNNKSLSELEHDLQTETQVEQYGAGVQQVFQQELGYPLSDGRLWEFMHPNIATPDLDRVYRDALMRGQPDSIGLGIRPQDEADRLNQAGIDPNKAFSGYQQIAAELPQAQRMAAIDRHIKGMGDAFPDANTLVGGATGSQLFRAIQLGDPQANRELQAQMSQEMARFKNSGGAVQSQSGQSTGLLDQESRQGL